MWGELLNKIKKKEVILVLQVWNVGVLRKLVMDYNRLYLCYFLLVFIGTDQKIIFFKLLKIFYIFSTVYYVLILLGNMKSYGNCCVYESILKDRYFCFNYVL